MVLTACRSETRETFDLAQARVVLTEKTDKTDKTWHAHKKIQLLIAAPNSLKVFDGETIVIDRGGSLAFLKGAQFGDRLPNMLQARLIAAFEDTRRLGGVARPGEGLAINYQILSDIRSFVIKTGHGVHSPQAYVEIGLKIVDDRNGQVKAAQIFTATSPIIGDDNRAYIQGLERALSTILSQAINWAFDYF